jgi:hypothetical protein
MRWDREGIEGLVPEHDVLAIRTTDNGGTARRLAYADNGDRHQPTEKRAVG